MPATHGAGGQVPSSLLVQGNGGTALHLSYAASPWVSEEQDQDNLHGLNTPQCYTGHADTLNPTLRGGLGVSLNASAHQLCFNIMKPVHY